MLAVLLGAGFSKWAAGLPLANELFDFQINPFGTRESKKLSQIHKLKADWDKTNPNAHAEEFINSILSSNNYSTRRLILWYIVRRLSEPYIWEEWHSGRRRRHVLMIDEYRKNEKPGVMKTHQFLTRLGLELSGIITPNYDLLIEYALGTNGFHYGEKGEQLIGRGPYPVSQWLRPVQLTGTISLAKLHGSISWDVNGKYTDGRRGLTGNALIVAPTPEKICPPILLQEWNLSKEILLKAKRILVFGFSFNPYDEAILKHLKEYGGNIKKVAVIDIASHDTQASEVWPHAEVRWIRPPPEDDNSLTEWLRLTRHINSP